MYHPAPSLRQRSECLRVQGNNEPTPYTAAVLQAVLVINYSKLSTIEDVIKYSSKARARMNGSSKASPSTHKTKVQQCHIKYKRTLKNTVCAFSAENVGRWLMRDRSRAVCRSPTLPSMPTQHKTRTQNRLPCFTSRTLGTAARIVRDLDPDFSRLARLETGPLPRRL